MISILDLNNLTVTVMTQAKAENVAAANTADDDDDDVTYEVEAYAHGFVVKVFSKDEYILTL